ncbi:hypothetical protein P2H44_12850 [Albimonas sp. CAU 1670]|uniref:hypothetical protein n=1 Tax=Albimonas sp. CAU 1670 TaxID=3032599 RepID=UPI0023D9C51F|nr:hypothetical protein [Albimonas sp. CAU 1670]MDF2233441.1 hypothetical protein [Albimonas sp. CAU 1670]
MAKRAIQSPTTDDAPGGVLLLALGDGACGALAAAGRPGAAALRDEISCGPLPPLDGPADDAAWAGARAAAWRATLDGPPVPEAIEGVPEPEQAIPADLATLRRALAEAGTVEFAMAASLQEILALAFLARLAGQEGALDRLHVRVHAGPEAADPVASALGDGAGGASGGLATLPPALLAAAPPARPVAPMAEALAEIWAAAASDPTDLPRLAARAPGAWPLPGVAAALAARLARFPSAESGLAREDALLLAAAGDDWTPARKILGAALRANVGPDRLGDLWLAKLLGELADPEIAPPALEWKGAGRSLRGAKLRRTELGRRLLAGEAFRLTEGRFRRDVGGARLDLPEGRLWLREGRELRPWRG